MIKSAAFEAGAREAMEKEALNPFAMRSGRAIAKHIQRGGSAFHAQRPGIAGKFSDTVFNVLGGKHISRSATPKAIKQFEAGGMSLAKKQPRQSIFSKMRFGGQRTPAGVSGPRPTPAKPAFRPVKFQPEVM